MFGSGIGAQLGLGNESTFNTGVVVTRFMEMNSENLIFNKKTVVGQGLRAGGLLPRVQRRVVVATDASGDILMEVPTRGFGMLMSQSMGSFPAPVTVSTGVYSYTFTFGDLAGHSFTAQVGVPEYGGTITPKTLTGCKVAAFELSVANNGILMGKFTIDAAGFNYSTALATASYPVSGSIFTFAEGSITLNSTPAMNVRDFSMVVENIIKQDRFNMGGAGTKSEQTHAGFRKVSGKMTVEFSDTIVRDAYLADTTLTIVVSFVGGTIASTYKETLTLTISAVKLDADTPNVAGPGPVDLAVAFEAYDDGTNPPLSVFYQTGDAAL